MSIRKWYYTKLGEQVPERIFTGANRGAAPVEGAPGILQTDKGGQFARTYRPAPGGVVAMDVPAGAPQTISKADLLTPGNMATANAYLKSVGARELDADFLKTQPDAAGGMILDALNKAGIRNKGPVYKVAPEEQAGMREGVNTYGRSLANAARARTAGTAAAPSPVETIGETGTSYNRFTGKTYQEPSLYEMARTIAKPVSEKVFGTPESWQKAGQQFQEGKRQYEGDLQRAARAT